MTHQRLLKGLALTNFACGMAFVVWLSCAKESSRGPVAEPSPASPSTAAAASASSPGVANDPPPPTPQGLGSLQAVVACLNDGGGVKAGRCLKPAEVEGIERDAGLNDHYFSASKAAILVVRHDPDSVVNGVANRCRQPPPPPTPAATPQQVAEPPAPSASEADVLACVLSELARRSRVP